MAFVLHNSAHTQCPAAVSRLQLTSPCSATDSPREHRPSSCQSHPRSFLSGGTTLTTFKPSLTGDSLSKWKGSRVLCHLSTIAPSSPLSVDTTSNPNESSSSHGRKARCFCKMFNGDHTAGERAFDDDEGGGNCDGTSWLHYLMDQAGIDTSHAQVKALLLLFSSP